MSVQLDSGRWCELGVVVVKLRAFVFLTCVAIHFNSFTCIRCSFIDSAAAASIASVAWLEVLDQRFKADISRRHQQRAGYPHNPLAVSSVILTSSPLAVIGHTELPHFLNLPVPELRVNRNTLLNETLAAGTASSRRSSLDEAH